MHNYLSSLYLSACTLNFNNIAIALKLAAPSSSILDVGCWDGKHTLDFAHIAQASQIYGIEPISVAAKKAVRKGIKVFSIPADTVKWPLANNSINCLVSNQVIEHLNDVDKYFSECYRVIMPGGYIITSTNNLSSLHNILAIIFGWAPFDLANCSYQFTNLGNPLSDKIHATETPGSLPSWTHKCIYTSKWLMDWQQKYGFIPIKTYGSGMYPFPSFFGSLFPKYSAFITTLCQKPI